MRKLQHYTNNAYDTIVLRDGNRIIGVWNGVYALDDYNSDKCDPDEWSPNWEHWYPCVGIDELISEKT